MVMEKSWRLRKCVVYPEQYHTPAAAGKLESFACAWASPAVSVHSKRVTSGDVAPDSGQREVDVKQRLVAVHSNHVDSEAAYFDHEEFPTRVVSDQRLMHEAACQGNNAVHAASVESHPTELEDRETMRKSRLHEEEEVFYNCRSEPVHRHIARLYPSFPPPPYYPPPNAEPPYNQHLQLKLTRSAESITKKVNLNEDRPTPLEQPQSPVPSSPSRSKKGIGIFAQLCLPFTTLDPQGCVYISWLLAVTFSYGYNSWSIPLRATFPYQSSNNTGTWLAADYVSDVVYLIDVVLVKPRLKYLHEGFWVEDPVETRNNYRGKLQYKFDVISLLPLDILYIWLGTNAILLRFPRLLKLQTFWEFHQTMDRALASPYLVRVGKMLFYIFYLIHLNACAYYAMSVYEGLGSNGWVFDGIGNAYIRCFYFATKTATSIGKNPKPENEAEYLFMTAAWLMGVFVFALLIGQIRDIIATATRAQTEYRKMVDGCSRYLRRLNMPPALQRRVTAWFTFTWRQQRCFDESRILNSLPYNMKRDVALAVHMSTLSKVQLFRNCSDSLLRDLVLQLRPVSFLPGDIVCRKGDVGNHMYIVKMGEVVVMGPDEKEVLATLREGSVFGEISLLGIDGARKRTATVRSRGYSNLFALSKTDLELALRHHRRAAHVLRRRADTLIRENAARQAEKAAKERPLQLKRRSTSRTRRRLSAVSENKSALSEHKACTTSLASTCSGMRTPLPTIMLSATEE